MHKTSSIMATQCPCLVIDGPLWRTALASRSRAERGRGLRACMRGFQAQRMLGIACCLRFLSTCVSTTSIFATDVCHNIFFFRAFELPVALLFPSPLCLPCSEPILSTKRNLFFELPELQHPQRHHLDSADWLNLR